MLEKEKSLPADPSANAVDTSGRQRETEWVELDKIVDRLYADLRRVAAKVHWKGPTATQPTSLLHDAYVRLRERSTGASHLDSVAVFATVMRRILIDRARKYRAAKRGGGETLPLITENVADNRTISIVDILDLDEALTELAGVNPRQARVVECRFMLGCSSAETAKILSVSVPTVERDWAEAKAFLSSKISPGGETDVKTESQQSNL